MPDLQSFISLLSFATTMPPPLYYLSREINLPLHHRKWIQCSCTRIHTSSAWPFGVTKTLFQMPRQKKKKKKYIRFTERLPLVCKQFRKTRSEFLKESSAAEFRMPTTRVGTTYERTRCFVGTPRLDFAPSKFKCKEDVTRVDLRDSKPPAYTF